MERARARVRKRSERKREKTKRASARMGETGIACHDVACAHGVKRFRRVRVGGLRQVRLWFTCW